MATVPELRAEAKSLGIVGYSRMTKPELLVTIEGRRALNTPVTEPAGQAESVKAQPDMIRYRGSYAEASRTTESDSPAATEPAPTDPRVQRREAARLAGSLAKVTAPVPNDQREIMYRWQNVLSGGQTVLSDKPLTPAQSRRMRKKGNKARGFNGCTLAQYREVKRRMRKAGML